MKEYRKDGEGEGKDEEKEHSVFDDHARIASSLDVNVPSFHHTQYKYDS